MSRQRKRVTERATPKTQLWRILRSEAIRLSEASCGVLNASGITDVIHIKFDVAVPSATVGRWLRAAGCSVGRGRPPLSRKDVIIDNDAIKDEGKDEGTSNKVVKQKGRN